MTKHQLLRDRQALLNEIAALQAENLRLRLGDSPESAIVPDSPEAEEAQAAKAGTFSRFPLLRAVDEAHIDCTLPDTAEPKAVAAPQVAEHLRRYAAAHFGIYAGRALYAHFLGAMAASDFILLRSESREQSALLLCNAVAAALGREIDLTAVQPQWSRPADLLGEPDPQTWRYNETRFLRTLYAAGWQEGVCFAALEGVTVTPPEGYLGTLLPVLSLRCAGEMRALTLARGAWPGDPVLLREGVLPCPENLWLFGALLPEHPRPSASLRANAMEFCLPALQGKSFLVSLTGPLDLPARQLRALFAQAQDAYALPEEPLRLARLLEDYLAAHMELSLGAGTEALLRRFGSVCLACGLRANDALDGFFYHKALRRLESAGPLTLRNELPGLRRFLRDTFGRHALPLTMGYLETLEQQNSQIVS